MLLGQDSKYRREPFTLKARDVGSRVVRWVNPRSPLKAAVAASVLTAVVMGGMMAAASIPDNTGVIHGCYNNKSGALSVIDASKKSCPSGTTPLTWNQTGQQGLPGPQGPQGAQGSTGQQGAQGPQGVPGSTGPQGAPGSTGQQGPQGAPGAQGPAGPGGINGFKEFTSTGTFTVPAGITHVLFEGVGGGGGGANGPACPGYGYGAGGDGGFVKAVVPVTPGATYNVVVGTAGVNMSSNAAGGSAGGNTELTDTSNTVLVLAGGGGLAPPPTCPYPAGQGVPNGSPGVTQAPTDSAVAINGGARVGEPYTPFDSNLNAGFSGAMPFPGDTSPADVRPPQAGDVLLQW
jgi:hypothetical protein